MSEPILTWHDLPAIHDPLQLAGRLASLLIAIGSIESDRFRAEEQYATYGVTSAIKALATSGSNADLGNLLTALEMLVKTHPVPNTQDWPLDDVAREEAARNRELWRQPLS